MAFFRKKKAPKAIEQKSNVAFSKLLEMGNAYWAQSGAADYTTNVIAHRCIKLIYTSVANLDITLTNPNGEKVLSGDLYNLLLRPNSTQGWVAFFGEVELQRLLYGQAFILASKLTQNSQPVELYVLDSKFMDVIPSNHTEPLGFRYTEGTHTTTYHKDPITGKCDVVQIKYNNPSDNFNGLSPLSVASKYIDIHDEGSEWNKKLLQNGARPSGVLTAESSLTDQKRKVLKAALDDKYQGSANAGTPLVLEGGMKWQGMGDNPKDMDFMNSQEMAARNIAQAFGIPPQLVGDTTNSTFNNNAEAKLEVYEQVIIPEANQIISELNHWLMPLFRGSENLRLSIDEDSISALAPRRQLLWARLNEATFLTDNEKREIVGLPPLSETLVNNNNTGSESV